MRSMCEKIARMNRLRPPPLNAVRVFEVAARHQSFTHAAAELNVTHSAVSRQIKTLESHLGVALFKRKIRQITLTTEGKQFLAEIAPALAQITAAAQALRPVAPSRSVRINVRPSFAVRWLIPRLPDFVARHPDIEPQVITSTLNPDKAVDSFDIAIRRGLEGWPTNMDTQLFLEDEIFVVAAPGLLQTQPVLEPRSLQAHVLLSSKTRKSDWADWMQHAGVAGLKPAGKLQFDHLHFVLQAVIDGLGVALCPTSLVGNDLASGRLVAPLPQWRLPVSRYYYGLAPGASPDTQAFVAWLDGMLTIDVATRNEPA